MAGLKFSKKLDSLPSTLAPDTVYFVKSGESVKMYVTDNTGTVASPVVGTGAEIEPFLLLGVPSG